MYCACGSLRSGKRAFDATERKDLSTWTSMIGGYAMHGAQRRHEAGDRLFRCECVDGRSLMPDAPVFTSVLHACSHCGLVEKGIQIFKDMKDKYKVEARMEHYGAVVDLLGRAGLLGEAERVVRSMPFAPNRVVLGSLLHARGANGELEISEELEKELLRLEDGSGFYVGVSNVYAKEGRWDEVGKIRGKMKGKGLRKEGGFSLVEVGGGVEVVCNPPKANEV
ncbi:uncharacterized protein A4U43_UnF3870 [Asparagus officinalis]|uniref:Pentatricopeptide repeat-containing protein n=1 Tax=Asparagus officinalis TaxID=4686 RepID=A0A1R3L733_ASPOF|nr:uncharacterized protein A4U43_UnF3870 [Asparagus officinalis]